MNKRVASSFSTSSLIAICTIILLVLSSCREKATPQIRIGFSQCISNHVWREAMNENMKLEALLNPSVSLKIYEAQESVEKQIEDIEQMIRENMDAIIVSPLQPESIVPVIEKAYDKGIPVILIDRKINSQKYTAYIGADNFEVGRNAGNIILSSGEKSINVVEVKATDQASPGVERSQGLHQVIDRAPNVKQVEVIDLAGDQMVESFSQILDTAKVDFDYVYAFNDDTAHLLWQMAKRKGLQEQIKFIGTDGLNGPDGGIELVRNGVLHATILYPTGGSEAVKLAIRILNGEDVPKNNILNTTVIDRFNADIMKDQFDIIDEQHIDIENQFEVIEKQKDQYYFQNNLLKITIVSLAIILGLALYSIYSVIAIRKKNRQLQLTNEKIIVQRNQIEKIANEVKESNEAKLNFFTGLSHEFKTPITLILSSIESLKEAFKSKGLKMAYEFELIQNNSNRLLRLVNNLLDFRKVEDQRFNIRASKTNLYLFSKKIFNDFRKEASKRNIDFKIICNDEKLEVFLDRNLMDKVYFNLLSNAFKFTPDNGKIEMVIEDKKESNLVTILFRDNGIGIPKNELDQVFKPFFKGSNNRKNSSGIGLHLSKLFVELHMGKIEVRSLHGTEFKIELFKGKTHFNEDQIIDEPDVVEANIIDSTEDLIDDESYLRAEPSTETDKHTLLIIEDNKELASFLEKKLRLDYDIHVSDGTDAVEMAFEMVPDIIICDVNLPKQNGFEICDILKKDLRTSHVPVIMLTALSDKDSYLLGLNSGVDLYLTKPFSYSILMQSIKSLLYNREKLRMYYTNNIYKIEQTTSFGNTEQEFVKALNSNIKDNLDSPNLSVEQLADNLNISRSQLYRKVKAILGISISDYINNFKLQRAKSMLETTSLSVSEIAYSNGFSSPNYFSTAFKQKYGESPDSYRRTFGKK
ncbi:substrate-binding domain-containing protein [Allomuricauda sp. M10]|uniref:substrate-binding domain-containing protein n=1 Tax=Allomuricauda sp. M10 TaxID=2683292 RepID=UPI001D187E18|nr:substrate-binding domain-containing protein [Muricauda sp. M10]